MSSLMDALGYVVRVRWFLSSFVLMAATLMLLVWAPGIEWRWARLLVRVIGALLIVFVVIIVGFGMLLSSHGVSDQITAPVH